MSTFTIDPFFPDKNLNRQGWLTDFITSRLHRVGNDRSDLANLLYDDVLTDETVKNFNLTTEIKNEIQNARKRSPNDKSIFLNPKYYDAVEKNAAISTKALENEKELKDYYSFMINAKPEDLATMVPFVNLKLAFKEPNEKTYTEVEVPFIKNLSTEVASILSDPLSRGQGAGIKSISAEKSFPGLGLTLNVNLNISYFFSSLSMITKTITNQLLPEEQNFSYAKLISFLPRKKQRLILEYGYGNSNSVKMQNILKAERKRIVLVYKSHKINIQEDGTVLVDASYLAESEAQLFQKNDVSVPSLNFAKRLETKDSTRDSLLQSFESKNEEYFKKQKQIQDFAEEAVELQQIGGNKKKLDSINKQKDTLKKEVESISKDLTVIKSRLTPLFKQMFIEEIIRRRQMFSLSFETTKASDKYTIKTILKLQRSLTELQTLKEFISSKSLSEFKDIKTDSLKENNINVEQTDLFKTIVVNLFDGVERTTPGKEFGVTLFFPLKTLISILYDLLPDEKSSTIQYDIPFTCFGNILAKSFGKEYSVNIGDILIEQETFSRWLYKSFDQKLRTEYSFSSILKDVIEELVPEAISKNNTGFYKANSIGSIRHLTYYTKKTTALSMVEKLYKERADFSSLRELFTTEKDKDAEPLIYYTQVLNPINDTLSPYHRKYIAKKVLARNSYSLDADSQLGIPHVSIGANKGLIKKVDFSSIEQPFLATSLVMQSLANGSTRLPRYAYNINVTMFGNNLFNQAGFLAVPSFGLEYNKNSADVSLGLTGYYVVTKVSDKLSVDGSYETSISAIFHDDPLWLTEKGNRAITKGTDPYTVPNEYINFSVKEYIQDLLALDSETLKALGITALPKETKVESTNTEKENKKKSKDKPRKDTP